MNRSLVLLASLVMVTLVFAGCSAAAPTAPAAAESAPPAESAPAAQTASDATSSDAASAESASSEATSSESAASSDFVTATNVLTAETTGSEGIAEARGVRTFVIVPSESVASYIADEEFFADALTKYGINAGKQDTIGTTQEISGAITLDLDNLSNALGDNRFIVMLNTLESDQGLRDSFIRGNGPRFNQYPMASFVANAIEGAPATYSDGDEVNFKLSGDLTIRDITLPATFDVAARLTGDILTGVAQTGIKLSEFGIPQLSFLNTLTVADDMGIKLEFTAQAQE